MTHGSKSTRLRASTSLRSRRIGVLAALVAVGAGTAGISTALADGGDNHVTVSAVSNPTAVTSGDEVQYIVTVSNKNSTSNSGAANLNNSLSCNPSAPCGEVLSVTQTSGPDAWACGATSCSLPTGMSNKAVDVFSVIAQTPAGDAGATMTDTATVSVIDVGGTDNSSASATTTLTAPDDSNGGTTTGFCPNTGCTISSGSEPSSNGTVGRISFPPFTGAGFVYTFVLAPGSFCSPTSLVNCTGLAMSTGPLAGPNPGQVFTALNPVTVQLLYGGGITPLSPNALTDIPWKSATQTGPGTQIPSCGTPVVTPCAEPPTRDSSGALVVSLLMSSGDPWVGSTYIP